MMKIPKIKVGDCIEIEWIDSNSPHPTAWICPKDLILRNPVMRIFLVGYFFYKREGYLCITGDKAISEDFVDVLNRVFYIPFGCIKSIRKLPVGAKNAHSNTKG